MGTHHASLRASGLREGELMGIFGGKKKEEKKADFSNVRAGGSSTAATPPPVGSSPAPQPAVEPQSYVVVPGDSLSKIAKRYYGDASQWRRIYEANRDQLSNPDLIHPGQRLKIPNA
jgi:nucleoid-associated protein YgaU